MGNLLCKPRCEFSPWVGKGSWWGGGGCPVALLKRLRWMGAAVALFSFLFFFFMGNLPFHSRLEGLLVFPWGGVLLRDGEMSMFYFGHHLDFLFPVGGFFCTFQHNKC